MDMHGWRRRPSVTSNLAAHGLTADETTFRKLVFRVAATALANNVFPV
jgi:hypothetical protein